MQLVKRKGMHRKCIYDLPRAQRRWWGCRRCDFFGAASILLLYARTKRLEYVVTYPDRRTFFTGGVPLSGPTRQLKRLLMETQRLASILAPRQPPDNGRQPGDDTRQPIDQTRQLERRTDRSLRPPDIRFSLRRWASPGESERFCR